VSTPVRKRPGRRLTDTTAKTTPLQAFLDANDLTSAQLEAEAKISRQTMTKIRKGRDVRRKTMLKILGGLRRLLGRKVEMHEIFNLDPDAPDQATPP
jgi:predicted transcriptional regulator